MFQSETFRPWLYWLTIVNSLNAEAFDKPLGHGGLALSRYGASAALLAFMLGCMLLSRQCAASKAH